MGISTSQKQEKPFCDTCQKQGHTDAIFWYNPNNRANPRQQVPRANAPAANVVEPNRNRAMGGPPRRFQGRNNWVPPNPQGNYNMNNEPCTYCGQLNHRQGPNWPLWCKHREERGIPIIRYDNQPPLVQVQ